jgi:hypothetical protein
MSGHEWDDGGEDLPPEARGPQAGRGTRPSERDPLKEGMATTIQRNPLSVGEAPAGNGRTNQPQDPNVDNVDNRKGSAVVGAAGGSGRPGSNVDNVVTRPGSPFPASPFRRPLQSGSPASGQAQGTQAQGTQVQRPVGSPGAQRPAPVAPSESRGGQDRPRDLSDSMHADVGLAPAPQAAQLERMPQPVSRLRPMVRRGPSGPSQTSVDAVRRAIEERQASKAVLQVRAVAEGLDHEAGKQPSRSSVSPQARTGTTVTQATLDQYLRRGQLLFDRYRRELEIQAGPDEVSPVEFTNWALSLKPNLRSATWRMYRQCLYHFLGGFPSHETPKAVALLDADTVDQARPEAPLPPRGEKPAKRTSALKEKRFPAEDFDRLLTYLRSFNRSRLAPILADWLRSGILTALRPSEWKATDLEVRDDAGAPFGRRVYLYVLSAKATNGRGTGLVRTLDLSAFPDNDLEIVRRMVERSRRWLEDGTFAEHQGQCSGLLYAAVEKIWPTRRFHYSLYSPRHQAIANWKAMPLPAAEIAAIVGHGVTSTASQHYGKRRSSWPPSNIPATPRPVPEELAVVRDVFRHFEHRLQLEVRAGLRKAGDIPDFPIG